MMLNILQKNNTLSIIWGHYIHLYNKKQLNKYVDFSISRNELYMYFE